MLYLTCRSAVLALAALGLFMAIPGSALPAEARTGHFEVRFEDIEAIMRAESPRAKIIAQEVASIAAARDRSRKWSNPSLAYDHEENSLFREWQVSLRKRFDQPFSQGGLNEGWDGIVASAELRGIQESENLLTEMKAGYVRLKLTESYLDRLTRFGDVVDMAHTVARDRHAEGALAGTEKQLIRLATFSLEATERRVRQDQRRTEADWRAAMGLSSSASLKLVTPINFRPWSLDEAAHYQALLSGRPGSRAGETLAVALGKQAEASKPSLVPAFDIYGGYKNFADEYDGFVAGVAVDLPLFSGNAGAAKQLEAERLIVENRLAMDMALYREEIAALVVSIEETEQSLVDITGDLDPSAPLTDHLLLQYREGTLSLDALLGAIQIEADALENYFDELAAYYLNIFRLETITGATIARFEP